MTSPFVYKGNEDVECSDSTITKTFVMRYTGNEIKNTIPQQFGRMFVEMVNELIRTNRGCNIIYDIRPNDKVVIFGITQTKSGSGLYWQF